MNCCSDLRNLLNVPTNGRMSMHATGQPWTAKIGADLRCRTFRWVSAQPEGVGALLALWGLAGRVSPQAHAVLLGMLAINPAERFTLSQVREAVNAWLRVELKGEAAAPVPPAAAAAGSPLEGAAFALTGKETDDQPLLPAADVAVAAPAAGGAGGEGGDLYDSDADADVDGEDVDMGPGVGEPDGGFVDEDDPDLPYQAAVTVWA